MSPCKNNVKKINLVNANCLIFDKDSYYFYHSNLLVLFLASSWYLHE